MKRALRQSNHRELGMSPSANGDQAAPLSTMRRRGQDLAWFLGIVVVAFAVRVVYMLQLRASPWFEYHDMDPLFHHEWAKAFAAGRQYMDGPYFRAPLYSWFLGAIYWLFGTSAIVPRLIQAGLGAVNCGLLFLIGRAAFNRLVGILAGIAAAVYWLFVYYEVELLSPALIVFLNLLLLGTLLWTRDKRKPLGWLIGGVLLGLSAIARPDILLMGPAVAVWIVVLHRPNWRRILAYLACFTGGCLLPIVPVAVRNYVVGHDGVLIASYGGVNFYIGNNPGSDGMSAVIPGDPAEWWPCYNAQVERAERAEGCKLKASEVSGYYTRAAWEFIRSNPGQALTLMLKKLKYFWSAREISNNQDIYFVTSTYTPIIRYLPVGFWIVGPLGFLGLLVCARRARDLFPLWGMILVYLVSVSAFFVTARFRMPAAMVLTLLASHSVYWCYHAIRARRIGALAVAAAALLCITPVVASVPPGIDLANVQGYRYAGIALAHQGKYVEAEQMLTEALAREARQGWPPQAATWYTLGLAQLNRNKLAAAEDSLEHALKLDTHHTEARQNLAAILVNVGRYRDAIPHYETLIQTDPANAELQASFGAALVFSDHVDEGLPHLLRAVELDSSKNATLVTVGRLLVARQRYADAIRLLREGSKREPDDLSLIVPLARLLAASPQPDLRDGPEAVRLAEHAVQLTKEQDASALSTAAITYACTGHIDRAIDIAKRSLELAKQNRQTSLAEEILLQLRDYEAAAAAVTTLPATMPATAP